MDSLEEMDKFLETCSLISKPQVLIQAEISPSIPWPLPGTQFKPRSSLEVATEEWGPEGLSWPCSSPSYSLRLFLVPPGQGGVGQEPKEALAWLLLARWPSVQQMRMISWLLEILSLVLLSTSSLAKVTHPD